MAAIWVELTQVDLQPAATLFGSWLQWVDQGPADADALYASCRDFWSEVGGWPRELSRDLLDTKDARRLLSIGLELLGYRYFAATILGFFGSQPSDKDLREGAEPPPGQPGFETLASARVLFANGPSLAWRLISEFRIQRHMEALPEPDPQWLDALVAEGSSKGMPAKGQA